MSRKRDTNWSRDEITVLLDSIMEITRMRASDAKRTNSREVFEYAAKKMVDKGHLARAEREKCRTKWKKMKEEFTHAKRAREGDTRYKEAPGIQPFYDRMEEFVNGSFDNISPHSTIVRRTSSLSSSRTTRSTTSSSSSISISNNNNDTSSTIETKATNPKPDKLRPSANPVTTNHTHSAPTTANNFQVVSMQNQVNSNPDISYRIESGRKQITIFGNHNLDIKFRGNQVVIDLIEGSET